MINLTSTELQTWIASILWPLTRILGLIAAAPIYGSNSVPISMKISLGIALTIIMAPILPALPAMDPMSLPGLLILVQQLLTGLAMGVAMRIVFSSVELAGELIGLTMGLGFATLFFPESQGRTLAISQFLSLLATMAFLSVNGHLVLLSALAESFITMPISAAPVHGAGFFQLANWGGKLFNAGVQLSLPIIAALLITSISLSILTRAAPQLNLYGIGFPLTLGVGFLMIYLVLPYMAGPLEHLFQDGIEKMRQIPRVLGGKVL
jgi:flagellar biosynthetic protein FliR